MCLYTSLVCFAMSIRTVHPSITFKSKQIEEHMSITVLHTDIIKQSLFKLNYKISIIQSFICYAQLFHSHRHTPILHAHTHIYSSKKQNFITILFLQNLHNHESVLIQRTDWSISKAVVYCHRLIAIVYLFGLSF